MTGLTAARTAPPLCYERRGCSLSHPRACAAPLDEANWPHYSLGRG